MAKSFTFNVSGASWAAKWATIIDAQTVSASGWIDDDNDGFITVTGAKSDLINVASLISATSAEATAIQAL